MISNEPGVLTPYSTVTPLALEEPMWVPEQDRERLASYDTYDKIYWSQPRVFKLTMRGTNDQPIYVPNARTIVNETAHYLLKGLSIQPEGGELDSPVGKALKAFLKREEFYSKFHTAKWSGVTRGDWLLHLTADPDKPEGRRISINSVDPAAYFPEYDDDDLDRVIAVNLVEQFLASDGVTTLVRRLRYWYENIDSSSRVVMRREEVLELEGWWKGRAAKVRRVLLRDEPLPSDITTIPVYHFKNIDWQGQPFGSSELRGFEYLLGSINQTVSDEELALAMAGLGVYATDAPKPTNDDGAEVPWEIAPAMVVEVPLTARFDRVDGVRSVVPLQDHLKYLTDALFEGSATFRTGQVDVAVAQSGVALAMKFLPTLAKLEQRDWSGTSKLEQLWFDWLYWHKAFEGEDFTKSEIAITLGNKLPSNRTDTLNELNNMFDRHIIDTDYYRSEMTSRLGYVFPKNMAARVEAEQQRLAEARMKVQIETAEKTAALNPANNNGGAGRGANNSGRPNESGGTEAKVPPARQKQ